MYTNKSGTPTIKLHYTDTQLLIVMEVHFPQVEKKKNVCLKKNILTEAVCCNFMYYLRILRQSKKFEIWNSVMERECQD